MENGYCFGGILDSKTTSRDGAFNNCTRCRRKVSVHTRKGI